MELPDFKFLQVDLTDEEQIEQTTKAAASWLSNRINVLVNNAGIAQPYMPKDRLNRKDAWRKYLATNLSGCFAASHHADVCYSNKTGSQRSSAQAKRILAKVATWKLMWPTQFMLHCVVSR